MTDWRAAPTLVGRHVTLRPLAASDRDALVAAAAADDLWDLFYSSVSQLKEPAGWFDRAFQQRDAGRALPFAVVDPAGTVVGTTRLMRMNPGHRRVEIGGTFYTRAAQRTGINTEAKLLLLDYAFEMLGCVCVQIRTDFLNQRSQTAIERLGAKRDGVLRGHEVAADGRVRDTVVYSILEHEWAGVRQNLRYHLARHQRPS